MDFFDSKEVEWADMKFFFAGSEVTKIAGVKYGPKQDKKPLLGAGNKPISIQRGNFSFEGSIDLYKGALDDINRAAKAAGGQTILDLEFDIVITFKPVGTRPLQTTTMLGVQAAGYEKGWEQGATEMKINIPILFLDIDEAQ